MHFGQIEFLLKHSKKSPDYDVAFKSPDCIWIRTSDKTKRMFLFLQQTAPTRGDHVKAAGSGRGRGQQSQQSQPWGWGYRATPEPLGGRTQKQWHYFHTSLHTPAT